MEREELKKEVEEEEELNVWREFGSRGERGFSYKEGLLVQRKLVDWETYRDVVVLPRSMRGRVLVLAHDKGGHLGSEKCVSIIGKYFIWPGMSKDVIAHCQAKSKVKPPKAPIVEWPVLSEPFE